MDTLVWMLARAVDLAMNGRSEWKPEQFDLAKAAALAASGDEVTELGPAEDAELQAEKLRMIAAGYCG